MVRLLTPATASMTIASERIGGSAVNGRVRPVPQPAMIPLLVSSNPLAEEAPDAQRDLCDERLT
jgi:hypothetical protein